MKLYVLIPWFLLITSCPIIAQQKPSKTFYLDYGFKEIFVNNDVAYVVDRYSTGPASWTDSVFTVMDGYLRQVEQVSHHPQGDTITHSTRWQANGLLQWQEERLGKKRHGPQLYYNRQGRLQHRHLYVAGVQQRTDCTLGNVNSQTCDDQQAMPQYPGGVEALLKKIAADLHYPVDALAGRKQGRILVHFVVDETGQVRNAHVRDQVFPSLGAESIRVVKGLAQFEPARKAGLPVPVFFAVPVTFSIR
ncbi:energy transducer TonB [Hymenobacter sp. NST-14]|uniref:energy transducer TonB n=1 Tax=Hymenobacter piscis TaxID=2839984 RepID=UPI001C01F73C|nr:energy transducer TonB [Hymenobacter piscis]MBT9394197.1 energy transducer TonB [Hymenobacter piscis]